MARDLQQIATEVNRSGIETCACSDVSRADARDSYVCIKAGAVTFEVGYWDDEQGRERTDEEIAAIGRQLCTTLVEVAP